MKIAGSHLNCLSLGGSTNGRVHSVTVAQHSMLMEGTQTLDQILSKVIFFEIFHAHLLHQILYQGPSCLLILY